MAWLCRHTDKIIQLTSLVPTSYVNFVYKNSSNESKIDIYYNYLFRARVWLMSWLIVSVRFILFPQESSRFNSKNHRVLTPRLKIVDYYQTIRTPAFYIIFDFVVSRKRERFFFVISHSRFACYGSKCQSGCCFIQLRFYLLHIAHDEGRQVRWNDYGNEWGFGNDKN